VEIRVGASGMVRMAADRSYTAGQRVTVAVRPEKLRLNSPLEIGNNLSGVAEEVIYIGTDLHYGVRLPDGQFLRARQQNLTPESKSICGAGETVTISFTQTAARVLTE
jgi:spermidine/putrescine transport system ATP-binding protein